MKQVFKRVTAASTLAVLTACSPQSFNGSASNVLGQTLIEAQANQVSNLNECRGLPTDEILNGSFETVNQTFGVANNIRQDQLVAQKAWDQYKTVSGWTSVDKDSIELWGGGFGGVTPTDGQVIMEIKGDKPNTISQDFCTTGGHKNLSLDVYARTGILGDNVVIVTVDGTQLLRIDPAHQFWKTYSVGLDLSKGKHTLQLSSEAGTNPAMGGLIDNIKLSNNDCVMHHRKSAGVETILMALSEIDSAPMEKIVEDSVRRASPVASPKVLFVKSASSGSEGNGDFTVIPNKLKAMKLDVTILSEPSQGLTESQVSGYDLIWYNNPGNPVNTPLTIKTLISVSQSQQSGVVLSGDDMAWNAYADMPSITKLAFGNNGTEACSQWIDNNQSQYKYIVNYAGMSFVYGDDIDQTTGNIKKSSHFGHKLHKTGRHAAGLKEYASASTNIPGCNLDVPAIVGYQIPKVKSSANE